jgi:hypothetical protein
MSSVNQRENRSSFRADGSIRNSTRVLRVDVPVSVPEPPTAYVEPPPTEPSRRRQRETSGGDSGIISSTIQALKDIPPEISIRRTGPVARLRPVQNIITAVNSMRSLAEEAKPTPPQSIQMNDVTTQKIETLEKTIKTLEEKLESKHDALMEMWKIRDEMEAMKQSIQQTKTQAQAQAQTENKQLVQTAGDEKALQTRMDSFLGEVKNLVDDVSKETATGLQEVSKTLDTKTHDLETAIGVLANQIAVVDKKEAVAETRIALMDNEIHKVQDSIKKSGEHTEEKFHNSTKSISQLEDTLQKLRAQQESLQKELADYKATETPKLVSIPEGPKIDEEKLKKELTEDVSSKVQSAMLKVQTERAEREREIVKEQREIRELISKTELKIMTEIKKTPSKTETKEAPAVIQEDTKLQERIRSMETELKILREKVGDVHTERRSRSNPRSRPHSSRELDSHRLAEFPLFIAELYNEQVIVGDSGLQPLVVPKHWEIVTDTDKGFNSDGIYIIPFPGCYDVNVIFKTISTSVTAQIYVEHLGADGKIVKSYALDQGALVNESTGTVKLMNMNGGEGIRLRIQTRFNMALVERQVVEETLGDGTKHEHHVVYNMIQIAYSPVRGFCEC